MFSLSSHLTNTTMPGGPELSEKIPDEIFQLVESFRKFIREQKAYKDQKFDVDPILEVDREADEFMLAFQRVSVDSETNSKLIQQIKDDTTKLLRHAELAYSLLRPYLANNPSYQQQHQQQQQQQQSQQQTNLSLGNQTQQNQQQQQQQQQTQSPLQSQQQQTQTSGLNLTNNLYQTADSSAYLSSSFKTPNKNAMDTIYINQTTGHPNQFGNASSSKYFAELADQFEARMRAYGEQIKELKMSLDSVIKTYNADELFKWLKKQHETLGEIAAKVYMTHERIMEKRSELDRSATNAPANNNTTTGVGMASTTATTDINQTRSFMNFSGL